MRYYPALDIETNQSTGTDLLLLFIISHSQSGLPAYIDHIAGVMVSMPTSSAGDCGFEPRSGQTKDYKIGICFFSAKHAALRRKSKDWLARNRDNVSEWATCLSADCCFSDLAL